MLAGASPNTRSALVLAQKLMLDMDKRLKTLQTRLGSREDDFDELGEDDVDGARARLTEVCSREYPFSDASAALARADIDGAEAVFQKHRNIWHLIVWLLCRMLPTILLGLARGLLGSSARSFGGSVKCQSTRRNEYLRDRVETAAKQHKPAGFPYSNGDLRTLLPFLFYTIVANPYERYWLRVPASPHPENSASLRAQGASDDEAIALDVLWPETLGSKSVCYVALHGLNGGSSDAYVEDFARNAVSRGSAVCVMINRGLMRTPVRGSKAIFHGARNCDVGAAVDAFSRAVGRPVALVGFSMGSIIAANFAVASSKNLLGAIAISGSLSCTMTLGPCGARSRRIWHPPLADNLLASFFAPNIRKFRLKHLDEAKVWTASTVPDFDRAFGCPISGYPSLKAYYDDMGAAGDGSSSGLATKFSKLRIPLLVLHSEDDPIIPVQANVEDLAVTASPHVLFLTTKVGGHVGWPVHGATTSKRFAFMTDVALSFAEAARASLHLADDASLPSEAKDNPPPPSSSSSSSALLN